MKWTPWPDKGCYVRKHGHIVLSHSMRVLLKDTGHHVAVAAGPPAEHPVVSDEISIDLFVRCFAELKGDQWQACSLEFGLAAQGDTFPEVRQKLDSMIASYVLDALTEDREHARELFSRRAPLSVFVRYHFFSACSRVAKFVGRGKNHTTYSESVPLAPRLCSV